MVWKMLVNIMEDELTKRRKQKKTVKVIKVYK